MRMALLVLFGFIWTHGVGAAAPTGKEITKGTVVFIPLGDQKEVPERYRLDKHQFDYEMEPKLDLPVSGVEVFRVRFPSPVKSPHAENNTVHAEYYRPSKPEKFPAVVVLDITVG